MARKSSAIETDWKIKSTRTRGYFPRDKIRCPSIPGNSRQRFFRSTEELADSSEMETRRNLPASPHAFASRHNRRPHDRLVHTLSDVTADPSLRRERRSYGNRARRG